MSRMTLKITPIMPVTILMTGLRDVMLELIMTAHTATQITVNKCLVFIKFSPKKFK